MKKLFISSLLMLAVSITFTLAKCEEDLNKDFGNLLTYYYINPRPERAPAALEKFISSKLFTSGEISKNNADYLTAYSFGRIAQLEPSIINKYEDLFNKATHDGRLFTLKIFQICGNEQVKEFLNTKLKDENFDKEKEEISKIIEEGIPIKYNPLAKEVKNADDLDFLWAEFMITGDERAIQKIIGLLEWPDLTRNKLNKYLKEPNLSERKEEIIDMLAQEYNIKCNITNHEIETQDDLDIIIANLQQQRAKSESFHKIINVLNLTDEDILYMATKGAANWSLDSNAQQHKKVFEICDSEIPKRSGSAKVGLLKISAYGYMSANNIEKATDRLRQLVSLDPASAWAHFSLGSIYIENKDIESASSEMKILQGLDMKLASKLHTEIEFLTISELDLTKGREIEEKLDGPKIISDIVDKCKKIKSYRTRFTLTDFTQKVKYKDFFTVEWDAEYVSPDRFFVDQSAWEKERAVYDRWITIDKEHYFQIGGWFKEPENIESSWRDNTNKFLALEKWIYLIQNNDVISVRIFQADYKEYIVLNFSPRILKDFWIENFGEKAIYSTEIWIERSSLFIVKARLKIEGEDKEGNKIDMLYNQIFKDYNSDIIIEKPKEIFDLNKGTTGVGK